LGAGHNLPRIATWQWGGRDSQVQRPEQYATDPTKNLPGTSCGPDKKERNGHKLRRIDNSNC